LQTANGSQAPESVSSARPDSRPVFQRPHLKRPLILLGAALVLCSFGLMWGLPNLFDFAQDSLVPYGTLAQKGFEFERITAFRYPPLHFWVLRVCFLPARALLQVPSLGRNPKMASTLFILSARLVSLAMALGTVWLLFATSRKLWDESAGLAAGFLFVASPVTLYYAKNANLDIPYVFWLAVALFFYVRILLENRLWDYLWLGVPSALAVCTKDQAYGFLLLMPVPILLRLRAGAKAAPGAARTAARKRVALALAGFLVPFLLIHDILFDPIGFWRHMQTILGPASQGWREFSAGPVGQLRLGVETLLRLMDAWTPAGLALVALGLAVALRPAETRTRLGIWLLVPAVSYYVGFLAVVGYVYPRFVLPIMLVLSLFAGRAVAWLWGCPERWRRLARASVVVLVGWVLAAGLSLDYVMSDYSRYRAQMWLERHASAQTRICYIGDMRDMPRFNRPLDARPCEPSVRALAAQRPDLVVVSLENGHPADRSPPTRPASLLRRSLGDWGRLGTPSRRSRRPDFMQELLSGRLGYREAARFEPPFSAFVPEVAESVNRTIVILRREET